MQISVDSNFMCRAMYRFVDPMMHGLWEKVCEFAEILPGERAIDLCCGTGSLALHYANQGIITDAIDYDPHLISNANRKIYKSKTNNISFHLANALYLPFENDTFDHASISLSLHEKENDQQNKVIAEMKRVVKKEGSIVFIDYSVPMPRVPSAYASKMLEFCAGRYHYRCFKDYIRRGGLVEIIKQNDLPQEKRVDLGPLTLVKTPNSRNHT